MIKNTSVGFAVFLIFLQTAPLCLAQQDTSKIDYFALSLDELMQVVITPSKFPQLAGNVTQKIDVITSQNIEAAIAGNRNISEVISKLPGASVVSLSRNDANWGTYGGIGPKYSTYMLNGLVIDAFVDPMSLDLNAVEKIEVQRGPASVFYPNFLSQDFAGSQSPLAGTVNLILKERISETRTFIRNSFGSFNTLNSQLYHQSRSGSLHYLGGISYEQSDYTDYGSPDSWLNMRKNPLYKKIKGYAGLTYLPEDNDRQKLNIYLHGTKHDGDRGRVYLGFQNDYFTFNSGYELKLKDNLLFQSHLGVRSYKRAWQESNFGIIDTLKSLDGVDQFILPVDFSLSYMHHTRSVFSIGADFQTADYATWTDRLNGFKLYGNKANARQLGIYSQEEWHPLDELVVRAGVRYSRITTTVETLNGQLPLQSDNSWERFLWSFGFKYDFNETNEIYFNAGSNFSPPSFKSIGGTIPVGSAGLPGFDGQLPNPGLTAENGTSFDLGIKIGLPDQIHLNVRGFYTIINNAILDNVISQSPSQTQSMNTESSTAAGGELEITQVILKDFSWFANITMLSSKTNNQFDADQDGSAIPFSPESIYNAGLYYSSPELFTLNMYLNYNSGFYDSNSKAGRTFYKPGLLLNVLLSKQLYYTDANSMEGFLEFYNLTNNKFDLPWQFKNTGFSVMTGIKVAFL
ncbi:MAG: TonB-dependent receptor [Ignavibacteriaceae bacterium]|nr:TonB-dependent receptor [Ignavibacteriaceae bacterium]